MSVLDALLGSNNFAQPTDNLLTLGMPRPAYGGYQFDLPNQPNPQTPTQQMPTPQMPHHGGGLKGLLGIIGDALLVSHGAAPAYQNRLAQERQQQALQGFLTNPDQAIQQLMQIDAPSAIQLYRAVHPAAEVPAGVRDYQYYKSLPADEQKAYISFEQAIRPQIMSPITLGPGDTYDPGTGATALPHVTDQQSYDAVPPGAQYTTPDGTIRTKGGQTATPSGNFP